MSILQLFDTHRAREIHPGFGAAWTSLLVRPNFGTMRSMNSRMEPTTRLGRSTADIHDGRIGSWTEFQNEMSAALAEEKQSKGAGLRLLTPTITSPTLGAQIRTFLKMFPSAKWHQYEAVSRDNVLGGTKLAFGEYVNTVYRLDRAEVILSLDSDLLTSGPGCVRYAREFARKRRVANADSKMNRLYAVESTPTNTGAIADHRLRMRASDIEGFARPLAKELGLASPPGPAISP